MAYRLVIFFGLVLAPSITFASIDCTFDNANLCGWSAGDAAKKRISSSNPYELHLQVMQTEDSKDLIDQGIGSIPKSNGGGFDSAYVFVTMGELTKSRSHAKLRFVSPTFSTGLGHHNPQNREVQRCFSFWYRAAGWPRSQPAVFAIGPVVSSAGKSHGRNFYPYNITTDTGHYWRFRQVDFTFDVPFDQIQIGVDAGDTYFSYVAFDGFRLETESCSDSATLGSNYRQLDGNCPGNFLGYIGDSIGCSRCSLTECIRMCEAYQLCRGVSWASEPPVELFPGIYQCYLKASSCQVVASRPERGGYTFYERMSGFPPEKSPPKFVAQPPWSTSNNLGGVGPTIHPFARDRSTFSTEQPVPTPRSYHGRGEHVSSEYPPTGSPTNLPNSGEGFVYTHQPSSDGSEPPQVTVVSAGDNTNLPPGYTAIPFNPIGLPGFTILPTPYQRPAMPPIAQPGMSQNARLWLPRASAVQVDKDVPNEVKTTPAASSEAIDELKVVTNARNLIISDLNKLSREDPTLQPQPEIINENGNEDEAVAEKSGLGEKPQFLYGYVPLQPFGNCGGHFIVDEAHQYLGCARCSFAQCATLCSLSDQCRGFSFTESVLVAKQCYLKTASSCEPQPSSTGFKYFIKISRRQQQQPQSSHSLSGDPDNYQRSSNEMVDHNSESVPVVETLFPPTYTNGVDDNEGSTPSMETSNNYGSEGLSPSSSSSVETNQSVDETQYLGSPGYTQLAGNCPGSFLRDATGQTVVCARCSLTVCQKLCDQSDECLGVSYSLDPLVAVQCYPKTVGSCSPLSQNTGYAFYSKINSKKR